MECAKEPIAESCGRFGAPIFFYFYFLFFLFLIVEDARRLTSYTQVLQRILIPHIYFYRCTSTCPVE